ncbi:hypothetical protein NLU13_6578 [Sarocladium strictum]|uniref:Secreted protein n=1 Tax=Sarocladium strictum TaxID=5046 RepID=A0AA39GIL0_SARSR|nr:hypothetical protein NLU13_6578 [Sarocladium strictum]
MKAVLVTLLALPAALAAPAAAAVNSAREIVADHLACTCRNAAGQTRASGICQARIGALVPSGVSANQEWCYSAVEWSLPVKELFPAKTCSLNFPDFPIYECKTFRFDDGLPCDGYSRVC